MPRSARTYLGRTGRFVLVMAMAATITAVINTPAANAEDPVNVIISSPQTITGGAGPSFKVGITTAGATSITNPGGTWDTTQNCVRVGPPIVDVVKTVCNGTPDVAPPNINAPATTPRGMPGSNLNSLVEESVAAVATKHGVKADDMLRAYGRAEIRAQLYSRMQNILNKKLYGKEMTDIEKGAYAELEAWYKQRQVDQAEASKKEYVLWTKNPCAYIPPAPPAGMAAVPNEVRSSAKCVGSSLTQLFTFTNGTPPASTFDRWAAYRNPTPSMLAATNAGFKQMSVNTISGIVMTAGTGAALAGGIALGFAAVAATEAIAASMIAATVAAEILLDGFATTTVTSFLSTWLGTVGATVGAFAGAITSVLIGIAIGAVAIYQLIEDAKPGKEIADRADAAAAQTDALGITARMADYAGLNMEEGEEPVNKPKAAIHEGLFAQTLLSQVNEWQMFSAGGSLIADPTTGYTAESTNDDYKFLRNGSPVPQGYIVLLAPNGTVGRTGAVIKAYRVRFSRGWLMVADINEDNSVSAYAPRLSVDFVDENNKTGKMNLLSYGQAGQVPKLEFQTTQPQGVNTPNDPADDGIDGVVSPAFRFKQNVAEVVEVTLQKTPPIIPTINVIPTAEGDFTVDHNVLLKANASDATPTVGITYDWVIERLAADGSVAETLTSPGNSPAFQRRFTTPGKYRAKVTLSGAQASLPTAGRIEFVIDEATPEVLTSDIKDSRELDGALSLNLRMLQNTRPYALTSQLPVKDDFTVKVDWATAADGSTVSETYQVQCSDAGSGTCDTGPLSDGPPSAPTNTNWSKSPTFFVLPTQNYRPYVNVTITNAYGQVIKRVFPITPGDQRPKYDAANPVPVVSVPAGTGDVNHTVDVVQVFPSTLPAGVDPDLTIQPYYATILNQLPPGMRPDITKKPNGEWWLQVKGSPATDSIGSWPFYFPFEQEPIGSGMRPPAAQVLLEVKAAVATGYRAILRGVPAEFLDRSYRNKYPDYKVQVAQVLPGAANNFTPFTGTVKCKLVSGPRTVFDKPCAQNQTFPWPTERITNTGQMDAIVYLDPASPQPLSADGQYVASLSTRFLNNVITTTTPSVNALKQNFQLKLDDNGFILAPYTGYTVTCSFDKAAYKPCFTNGTTTLLRTPGPHTIDVKSVKPAPNAATTTTRYTWTVATPKKTLGLKLPVTSIKRGKYMTVKGSLLLPRENYTIRIGGITVATGRCTDLGTVSRAVKVPARLKPGRYKVVLVGANNARTTYRWLTVKR